MYSGPKKLILAAALLAVPAALEAQVDFTLAGRQVQIHSFASQGFADSNVNNYLTMDTSSGSFAFTDAGANISTQITDKFRVGAQFYTRNLGKLGNFEPTLDWAVADYRFKDWFGIRAGKVKTALGLYNDTQDLEFLHTWAILPQSSYPLDLRAATIAHEGADLYGTFSVKKAGSFAYTGYIGSRADDPNGGYSYGLAAYGFTNAVTTGSQMGGDLRWTTPLPGLTVGASYLHSPGGASANLRIRPTLEIPVNIDANGNTKVFYADYKLGRLTLDGEYRRELDSGTQGAAGMPSTSYSMDERGWWASASYRICKRLELGTYHSRFYPNWGLPFRGAPANHLFDQVAAARIDLNSHWDLKLEGHFIDGYGSPSGFRGFYPQDNPAGLQPTTRMLVVRTGWNF